MGLYLRNMHSPTLLNFKGYKNKLMHYVGNDQVHTRSELKAFFKKSSKGSTTKQKKCVHRKIGGFLKKCK